MHGCRHLALFILLTAVVGTGLAQEPTQPPTYAYRNGRWFDGKGFRPRTFYSVNGILQARRPAVIDREVDLQGMYVLPACGEAHNHNATAGNNQALDDYLRSGILYVKNPENLPRLRKDERINTPTGVDVIFSNGGLTSPGGHPLGLVQRNIERGAMKREDGEGAFYFTVDSLHDLEEKWPKILAAQPDFIKTILVYSEELERRRKDNKYFSRRGLDPALLRPIVEKAHKSGLTVSTHVESAADFHHAVEAGVDEINHMPGFWPSEEAIAQRDFSAYHIAEADARQAGKQRIRVVTTLWESLEYLKTMTDSVARERLLDVYRANIALLNRHHVPLLTGSDQFRKTSQAEVLSLAEFKLMTNQELLTSWCEATPQAIFPQRRIGKLRDGYEANFVVLPGNPLQDMTAVREVRLVFKNGQQLVGTPK